MNNAFKSMQKEILFLCVHPNTNITCRNPWKFRKHLRVV